ncbi:FAD-dependent oxidoreductase [Candidatus Palauibacter irciniicola]|uniref:FAD-dependent oxidoreductase n=1 Tax=Candidatus Palauibacter irciniicola TaxID=3056733 RepID=UPI003B014E5D
MRTTAIRPSIRKCASVSSARSSSGSRRCPRARHLGGYASLYTITDDWHPIVGPEPGLEGYYAFFGGSGHGFKLGPPIGEALADVICGEAADIDISPFRPGRFIDGEPLTSAWGEGNRG